MIYARFVCDCRSGTGGATADPCRLFVSGIPSETTRQEIWNLFASYGTLIAVDYIKKKSIAFVRYSSMEGASNALEQRPLKLHDIPLQMKHADNRLHPNKRSIPALFSVGFI